MVTRSKKRKLGGTKKRFIGKPGGQIQERVQAVGPEHFGVVAVDCAKRRSKWMLCDFFGKQGKKGSRQKRGRGQLCSD